MIGIAHAAPTSAITESVLKTNAATTAAAVVNRAAVSICFRRCDIEPAHDDPPLPPFGTTLLLLLLLLLRSNSNHPSACCPSKPINGKDITMATTTHTRNVSAPA